MCLEDLENHESIQDNRSPGQDLNPRLLEYDEVLVTSAATFGYLLNRKSVILVTRLAERTQSTLMENEI
jgi:hypothetical protein